MIFTIACYLGVSVHAYKLTWPAKNGARNLRHSQVPSDLITFNEHMKHEQANEMLTEMWRWFPDQTAIPK